MIELPFMLIQEYLDSRKNSLGVFENISGRIDLSEKKIILLNLPHDSNLGDHAQTICATEILKKNFPEHKIYSFPAVTDIPEKDMEILLKRLSLLVSEEDFIVFHSGYHINDIYNSPYDFVAPTACMQIAALRTFRHNKILYLPQTINLSEYNLKKYADELLKNSGVTMFCRDRISFENAEKYFPCSLRLMPDVVTSMIGRYIPPAKKNQGKRALIVLRNRKQKESFVTDFDIDEIEKALLGKGYILSHGGTYIDEPYEYIVRDTEKTVKEKICEFAGYDLIVTDLYHGMIFSVVASTPVLVLPSSDHKIRSGIEFFRENHDFDDRVFFFERIEEYVHFIRNLPDKAIRLSNPPAYFWEKYWKNWEA